MNEENLSKVMSLLRGDIASFKSYRSARSESSVRNAIMLDANESPYTPLYNKTNDYNRYPEPQSEELADRLSLLWGVDREKLLMTRGSDEAIDLLCRGFCEPNEDAVLIPFPSFEIYEIAARLQRAEVIRTGLDLERIERDFLDHSSDRAIKMIFLCSPNNPTGESYDREAILDFICRVDGRSVVVLDEAYVEFSDRGSLVSEIDNYPWLVVLRTVSKAWGLAGLRLGGLVADKMLIGQIRKIQQVYPIPKPVEDILMQVTTPVAISIQKDRVQRIKKERVRVASILGTLEGVREVYPSDSNFLLVCHDNHSGVLSTLFDAGIVVRDRSNVIGDSFRVSIGKRVENDLFLRTLGWSGESKLSVEKSKRKHYILRETNETSIEVEVDLESSGHREIDTGIGFFDHMLEQIPLHGGFSLRVFCRGDLHTDPHHLIEDTAIVLGSAILEALGSKEGIGRYGFVLNMDESRSEMSIDLSGRGFFLQEGEFQEVFLGGYPAMLTEHFLRSFSENLKCSLHLRVVGKDPHHQVESCYKCLGRVLKQALAVEGVGLPSSKGSL